MVAMVYKTADGEEFESQAEAEAHEAVLANADKVKDWLARNDKISEKKVPEYHRIILAWEADRSVALGEAPTLAAVAT